MFQPIGTDVARYRTKRSRAWMALKAEGSSSGMGDRVWDKRVSLTAVNVLRVRFGHSALLETSAALRTLQSASRYSPYAEWLTAVADASTHPTIQMLLPLHRPEGETPEFLGIPRPGMTREVADPEAEWRDLRGVPAAAIRSGVVECLQEDAPALEALLADDDPAQRLAEAMHVAFDLLVAPWWTRIQSFVHADIAYWTSRLATEGLGTVLDELHNDIAWDGTTLSLGPGDAPFDAKTRGGGLIQLPLRLLRDEAPDPNTRDEGLALLPLALLYPVPGACFKERWQTTLLFPTRSVGKIWEDSSITVGRDPLADLLGRNRASILSQTVPGRGTLTIARSLGLSPATVSEHLSILRASGLVTSFRAGRSVIYQSTNMGRLLLEYRLDIRDSEGIDGSPPGRTSVSPVAEMAT